MVQHIKISQLLEIIKFQPHATRLLKLGLGIGNLNSGPIESPLNCFTNHLSPLTLHLLSRSSPINITMHCISSHGSLRFENGYKSSTKISTWSFGLV